MKMKYLVLAALSLLLLGCSAGSIKSGGVGVGLISVNPEEEVNVVVQIDNGKVVSVTEAQGEGSVTFSLSKMPTGMMLSASNKLDYIVKYDIYMIDYNGKKHYTSSCPVMAGSGVFESWPHNIPKLSIENFRVVSGDGEMVCQ